MKLIEIAALENGAHRNQEIYGVEDMEIPEGYAVIPEDMEVPETFPFVNVKAELVTRTMDVGMDEEGNPVQDTFERMEVVELTPGEVPPPEPEPPREPTDSEILSAMLGLTQ